MNIEESIILDNKNIKIDKTKLPKLIEIELELIENYVEFTRHFQEINQLFEIFTTNFDILSLLYILNTDDTITRKINLSDKQDDEIAINTLVINYISSAKTFVESVECFIKQKLGKDELNKFKENYLSKIYDDYFSYRLLIRLRDYSQHGHLPVNVSVEKRYSFDLQLILNTPNYKHNGKIKKEMAEIEKNIFEEYGTNPLIAFSFSIEEFKICIYEIYLKFIDITINKMQNLEEKLKKLIANKQELVYKSNDYLNGLIFYSVKNGIYHCLDPKEEPTKMIHKIKRLPKKNLQQKKVNLKNRMEY